MNGGDTSGDTFDAALKSAACAVMLCDATASGPKIRFVNAAFTAVTGYSAEEAVGRSPGFLQGPGTDRRVVAEIGKAMSAGTPVCRELLNYRKDGRPFWNQLTVAPTRGDSGEIDGFVGLVFEGAGHQAERWGETSAAHASTVLESLTGCVRGIPDGERYDPSLHDDLTGLTNGDGFRRRLRSAVERASPSDPIALFRLDLDDFQDVNESRGEAAGDEALRQIARRLSLFAVSARGSVARVGGDEFALLIRSSDQGGLVETTARSLCELVAEPLLAAGRDLALRGSVGVTVYPPQAPLQQAGGRDPAGEVMKQADLALQAAKQEYPGDFRLYDGLIEQRRRDRVALRESLTEAIADEAFELHYQPFVAIDTGAIAGAEALVRWIHPVLGVQPPESFIPLAESSGLIVPLGEWILRRALRQGASWRRQGLEVGRIAINLSGLQLRRRPQRPDFLATLEAALAETGADPAGFEFELTESAVIDSSEETIAILRSLKAMGFGIAIDDFGTGHASFRYLRDLLFDKVKVDRSFIRGIGEDGESEAIVSAMIGLTRMLGAKVVGEGVESTAHRDFLCEHGCDFGQGYLFSPPLDAAAFGALVERRATLPFLSGGPRAGGA